MAIARISDIRGLVTMGDSGEILKERDPISDHGGLLKIEDFVKVIFEDGREIEIQGPVEITLDSSFFEASAFEPEMTQISDTQNLEIATDEVVNNPLEFDTQVDPATANLYDANIDSEQLDTNTTTRTVEFAEPTVVQAAAIDDTQTQPTEETVVTEEVIEEEAVNQGPVANALSVTLNEDDALSGTISFFDPDGTATIAANGTLPEGLTLNPDGTFTFDADSYDSLAQGETQTPDLGH